MLVLTRFVGQEIRIGDAVVSVLGIQPGVNGGGLKVRLGISAPDHVNIVRREIDKTERQKGPTDGAKNGR